MRVLLGLALGVAVLGACGGGGTAPASPVYPAAPTVTAAPSVPAAGTFAPAKTPAVPSGMPTTDPYGYGY